MSERKKYKYIACQKCGFTPSLNFRIWNAAIANFEDVLWCEGCIKDHKQRVKQAKIKAHNLEKAPYDILLTMLKLKPGEEWHLKLSNAEFLIKAL
jgi:hypothetical protein